jgi:hypothetical protein
VKGRIGKFVVYIKEEERKVSELIRVKSKEVV